MSSAYLSYEAGEERRRLQLQANVLEPLSQRALARIGLSAGAHAIDVGCGAIGLVRALARHVGPTGRVVGSDVAAAMIDVARATCDAEALSNVELVVDDLFASKLAPAQFDLVLGRFLLAPLGRDGEIVSALERLARPGGVVLLEEPDAHAWRVLNDEADAHRRLVSVIERAYDEHMGGFSAGRRLLSLARARGWRDIGFDAHVLALPPGHPYLRAPVMMATALRPILLRVTSAEALDALVAEAEALYARADTHGVTFTLVQVWGRPPDRAGD